MKKTLIILIPGNPSIPGVYDPFIEQLKIDLKLAHQIRSIVLSHLGQCNQRRVNPKKISVFDVIQEHKKTVSNLIQKEAPDEVIIIGHSLGSAVTINLYDHFKHQVAKFFILCPFLGPAQNNRNFLKVIRNPMTRLGLTTFSRSLFKNPKAGELFLNKITNKSILNPVIYEQIKEPHYIPNFLNLVSHYLDDFKKMDMPKKIGEMDPEKSFFLFAPNDYWVPDDIFHLIPPRARVQRCMNIKHDFCLEEKQYRLVSSIISEQYHNH